MDQRREEPWHVLIYGLVFWSAGTLFFDGLLVSVVVRQLIATSYPTVPGVITHSFVERHGSDDGVGYRPGLWYSYTIDGKRRTGTRYRYGNHFTGDRSAHRVVAAHPVGQPVTVYHHPTNPYDTVLKAGIEGEDLFLAMAFTPFNVIMVGGWCWAWKRRQRQRSKTPFPGLKVVREGERLRVRVGFSRLAIAGGTAAGLCFVLIFVVGLGAGLNPPLPEITCAWGLVLGASAVAYLLNPMVGRGPRELVLDGQTRQLELYRRSRRTPVCVIDGSAVQAVTVATFVEGAGADSIEHYVPTVIYAGSDGTEQRQPLGYWRDREAADVVAASVRDWLTQLSHVWPAAE